MSSLRYADPDVFNSGSVGAVGTLNVTRNIGASSVCNFMKIKVTPSASTVGWKLEIFKKATRLAQDRCFSTTNLNVPFVTPTDRSGNEVLEGFVLPYEDLDADGKVFLKLTNLDASARNFDVELTREDILPLGSGVFSTSLVPAIDNTYDLGSSTGPKRWGTGYFNNVVTTGNVKTGATPAGTGQIRLSSGGGIYSRDSGNTADVRLISSEIGNHVYVGDDTGGDLYLQAGPVKTIYMGFLNQDVNVNMKSLTNTNHFWSDAGAFGGVGAFGFGAAADAIGGGYILIRPPALTIAANSYPLTVNVAPTGTTIPSGTSPFGASLNIEEPNFTNFGTITIAATLRVGGAPTEGGINAAVYVVSGASRFNSIFGITDNSYDVGSAALRWRSGFFGTSVEIGASPATVGMIRIANGGSGAATGFIGRNAANDADVNLVTLDNNNTLVLGDQTNGGNVLIRVSSGKTIYLNDPALDVDINFSSDTNANHFWSDAGLFNGSGAFGFGITPSGASFIAICQPAATAIPGQGFFRFNLYAANAITIPSGNTYLLASMILGEPNVTLAGGATINDAYTLVVGGAPTEGSNNGAIWSTGTVRLDGDVIGTDNTYKLGDATHRWASLYLGTSLQFGAVQEYAPTKTGITDNTLADLFTVSNSSDGNMSGGSFEYTATIDTGSAIQVESGVVRFALYNNGGAVGITITKFNSIQQLSSGTLSVVFTTTSTGPGEKIQVTIDSSLNSSSTLTYKLLNNSAMAVTVH